MEWLGWEALVEVMGERYVRELLHHRGLCYQGLDVQLNGTQHSYIIIFVINIVAAGLPIFFG